MNPVALLDARTVELIHFPVLLLLAALSWVLWRQSIGGRQSLLWSLGQASVAVNMLIANLREVLPPISAAFGFAFTQVGVFLVVWGIAVDVGRKFPARAIIAILAVIQFGQTYFLVVEPDIRIRVMMGGLSLCVMTAIGAYFLATERRPYRLLPSRFTVVVLIVISLAHAARFVGALIAAPQDFTGPVNQANFSFGLMLTISFFASLCLAVGLLWLRITDWHRTVADEVEERRRSEAALAVAKEAAEVAAQAKSRFYASVSHDIRTPMNAIIGLTRLLARTSLNERQGVHVSRIGSAAGTLLELIEGVLDAARIEAGTMNVEIRNFDLGDVLARVDTIARVHADAKGLALEVVPAPDVPMSLYGDPVRLGQILLNLVGNAVKFTEAGEVTLSIAVTRRDPTEAKLRFIIHDTGPGIATTDLPHIFEPFRQGATPTKGGTGLGLAIAAQLTQLMDGKIAVESVLGLGSTFTVDLLFRVAAVKVSGADAPLSPRFDAVRVLVVEDDEINREVAKEILTDAGAVVEMVTTGKAAVARLSGPGRSIDVILMDVRMPEMDGIAATAHIRALHSSEALPIIAVTAHAFDDERDACLAVGMNDFVTKPIEPARLLTALARCIPARVTFVPTAQSPQMAPLPLAIPGFDISATLGRFCGNTSAVQRLLSTFSTRCTSVGDTLRDAVTEGRMEEARALVHGFRGAAATLGAANLSNQAARLEAALKHDDRVVVPDEMAALTREMELASNALKACGFP